MMASRLGIRDYDFSENANIKLLAALKQKDASETVARALRHGATHPSVPRVNQPTPRPIFDYRSDPRFALTPSVSGGELADQMATRNTGARMAATTPRTVTPRAAAPAPVVTPTTPPSNEPSLLDELNMMSNRGAAFINDAYDDGLDYLSELGSDVLGVVSGSNKLSDNELKAKFIKDNGLSISSDKVFITTDEDGNRTLRMFDPNSKEFQQYQNYFIQQDKDPRSIIARKKEYQLNNEGVLKSDAARYCISTATGLLCNQGTMDPNFVKSPFLRC
jgi:hypothetical protein